MEGLFNLILDEESRKDNFLLKLNEKRQKRIKRRNYLLQATFCKVRRKIPKIKNKQDDIFYSNFGMSPTMFKKLQTTLRPFWPTKRRGRCGFPMEQCLHITLWKLCNSRVTFRQLSDRFNLSKGTAHEIFYKTVRSICSLKDEISWPSAAQQQNVMEQFLNSRYNSLPYVIGCVGGTHLKIPAPKKDAISYYNRMGFYSIIIQAICDSKFRFLDVFIGYPGSCHDDYVWKNSPIFKAITSGNVELAENAVILGDSAYPLSEFLMVPYKDNGHLSSEEKKFNFCLSSTRVFTEQAFGLLKQKFKILNHIGRETPKTVAEIVLACAILHNFILNNGDEAESLDPLSTDINETIYVAGSSENSISPMTSDTNETIPISDCSENSAIPTQEAEESIDGIFFRDYLTTLLASSP